MEASRALPSALALRAGPATLTIIAAGLGVVYALAAYRYGASTLPYAIVGTMFLGLALWRLEYGLAVLIVVAPLSGEQPLATSDDEQIRAALSVVTSLKTWLVLLVALELGRAVIERRPLKAPAASIAIVALLVAAGFGVLIAPSQSGATADLSILAGAVSVFFLIALFIDDWQALKVVLAGVVAAGLLISAHAIWQYQTGDVSRVGFFSAGGIEYRVASFFEHPNQLAGFAAVMVPVGIGLYRLYSSPAARAACATLVVLAGIATLITFSRGALLALAALPFVYIGTRRAWPVIVVAGAVIAIAAPAVVADRVAGIGNTSSPEIASRLDLWEAATEVFEEHPIEGVGLDGFGDAYVDLERTDRLHLELYGIPVTAHSLYLNTLAEQGLIGIFALVALVGAVLRIALLLRRSADERKRALGQMLAGVGVVVLVHSAFDVTFTDNEATTVLVLALVGIGAAALRLSSSQRPMTAP